MHPSVFVVLGTVTAGVILLLLNRHKLREGDVYEAPESVNRSTFGGPSSNDGNCITAQRAGADSKAVQAMLNEVESRLKRIRRMQSREEQRRAVASLKIHYSPEAHAGTNMEATFELISIHIQQRLQALNLAEF